MSIILDLSNLPDEDILLGNCFQFLYKIDFSNSDNLKTSIPFASYWESYFSFLLIMGWKCTKLSKKTFCFSDTLHRRPSSWKDWALLTSWMLLKALGPELSTLARLKLFYFISKVITHMSSIKKIGRVIFKQADIETISLSLNSNYWKVSHWRSH